MTKILILDFIHLIANEVAISTELEVLYQMYQQQLGDANSTFGLSSTTPGAVCTFLF